MNSGIYAACAALVAQTDSLDTIANNLANVSTAGFRARDSSFSSVLAASSAHPLGSVLNQATNSYGVLGSVTTSTEQGSLSHTGNPLDLAIDGDGWFAVQTAGGGTAYTRAGAFRVTAAGRLTTADGHPVLGQGGPVQLIPGAPVTVSPDGILSSNGAAVGRLRLVSFAPGTDLANAGGSLYTVPASATPLPARGAAVEQGVLEGSDVNPVAAVVTLINAQRQTESIRHALSMLDSQMNKTASEDLPRVTPA
jgi:flagellar basal-body rod protein FlgF